MAFVRVDNFLGKFKKLESGEDREKRVYEILKKTIPTPGIKVAVRRKTIYFYDLSPTAKNEIFLRKKEILEKVRIALKEKAPDEISFRKP